MDEQTTSASGTGSNTPAKPPAEANQTEIPPADVMIPKARFDEINRKLRELETTQAKADKERAEAERRRLEEDKRWQDLYENERKARADSEAQIAAVLAERKQETIRASIVKAASAAGFADPEDAWRFIQFDDLTVDESGNVTNAQRVVEALAKSKTYLLNQGKPAPGVQAGPKPARITPLTQADLQGMSTDEMRRDWDAVKAALRQ